LPRNTPPKNGRPEDAAFELNPILYDHVCAGE
jgi:hypothetical protein